MHKSCYIVQIGCHFGLYLGFVSGDLINQFTESDTEHCMSYVPYGALMTRGC